MFNAGFVFTAILLEREVMVPTALSECREYRTLLGEFHELTSGVA